MHQSAKFASADSGVHARAAGPVWLAAALQASRQDTLATFAAYERTLGAALNVPHQGGLNPPRWELGHIGWFQAHWLMRNPQRLLGDEADPDVQRLAYGRADADRLYDSSRVAHAERWHLALPSADETRAELAPQLDDALTLLQEGGDDDRALYFHRLALFHEDMHHEAALYMARALAIEIDDPRWRTPATQGERQGLPMPAADWAQGLAGPGFAFDNERLGHLQKLPACCIDSRVLNWAEYLPFIEQGGYADDRWWTDAGRVWLGHTQAVAPRYLRRVGPTWHRLLPTGWQLLDLHLPAEHLTAHEAEAWCRWAGRRLPTEAEWERAACGGPGAFTWGLVWEWTASVFAPYPGFRPHPYRDYSQPWFDGRPVLRGASYLTQPRMRHPRYRNFFTADRNDIAAGFRTCALAPG